MVYQGLKLLKKVFLGFLFLEEGEELEMLVQVLWRVDEFVLSMFGHNSIQDRF